jgi:hypothetical protein
VKKKKIKRGQVAHIILAHSWLIFFWSIVGTISLFFWHLRYSLKPMPISAHSWLTFFWPKVGLIFLFFSLSLAHSWPILFWHLKSDIMPYLAHSWLTFSFWPVVGPIFFFFFSFHFLWPIVGPLIFKAHLHRRRLPSFIVVDCR